MRRGRYLAELRYCDETGRLHGRVVNLPTGDMVLIEGESLADIHQDFRGAIEDYEAALRETGRIPLALDS